MDLPFALAWLRRRAENVLAAMLAALFAVFLLQIVSRYMLSWPLGWTHEASVILNLWIVLFGAALVVRDDEEMRFDLLYASAGPTLRRVMVAISSGAVVGLLVWAMPAAWDYITFMRRETTAYLDLRFDWVYSVYLLFAVAMIVRHLWFGWKAVFGHSVPAEHDLTQKSSAL